MHYKSEGDVLPIKWEVGQIHARLHIDPDLLRHRKEASAICGNDDVGGLNEDGS